MDAQNVTTSKPKIGGAIFSAPLGTALPTNATTALNAAFKNLGFISVDGIKNINEASSERIKAWGGATVGVVQTEKVDTFTYKLIEATNVEALKEAYGAANVTGTLETGIIIKANSNLLEEHCVIVEMMLKDSVLKRIVIPRGQVSKIGEISYVDKDAVGYEVTLEAIEDTAGNTHYEYIQKAKAGGA